jgi:hypothetical protein
VSVTREYLSLSYELGRFALSLAWHGQDVFGELRKGGSRAAALQIRNGGQRFCPPFVGLAHGQGCCVLSGYLPELELVVGCD